MGTHLVAGMPPLWKSHPGERGECAGCGYPLISRAVMEVLEDLGVGGRSILIVSAACGLGIMLTTHMDALFPSHGGGIDASTGVKRLLPDRVIVNYGGDGDITAIGAANFIAAAARAEKITTIMINNGHFAMTGGQMAPTTPMGLVTTTTPSGRKPDTGGYSMNMPKIIATVKGVAYSARGAVNSPANLRQTKKYLRTAFQKQIENVGFSFVEIVSMCPMGWHVKPLEALKLVEEKFIPQLPLGEYKNVDRID